MTLPLDTAPGPSPDEESVRNAQISREFLAAARQELAEGDLLQASEKAWGAAAFAVKAVAEKRRWFNEADWKLRRVADVIAAELGNDDIVSYYLAGRDAHFNFYHHEYDHDSVGRAINLTAKLLDLLDVVLSPEYEPPFVSAAIDAKIRGLEQPTSDPDRARLTNGRPPIE